MVESRKSNTSMSSSFEKNFNKIIKNQEFLLRKYNIKSVLQSDLYIKRLLVEHKDIYIERSLRII
jgi:hypothetical protein